MTEKRAALIIASYQYNDEGLRQLVAPAQDAVALARVLENTAIGGFKVQILQNEPSYIVNREIETFFSDRKRDDLLLLYFSGHGIKDAGGRLYFAMTDTIRKILRATAVSATLVNDVMHHSRSRRQVLLLDCCYSGAFAHGMFKADNEIGIRERFEGRGRTVLTASDATQYAFEGDTIRGKGVRSIFTGSLVHGLETGEADLDGDGSISLDELYNYVEDRVIDETPQQRPMKWDFGVQGKIILARNPNPVVKSAKLPLELQQAIENSYAGVREGVVRDLNRLLYGNDKRLALGAHIALTRLTNDDNGDVSAAATKSLAAYREMPLTPVQSLSEIENLALAESKEMHIAMEEIKPEPPPTPRPSSPSMPKPDGKDQTARHDAAANLARLASLAKKYFLIVERLQPRPVLLLLWVLANVVGVVVIKGLYGVVYNEATSWAMYGAGLGASVGVMQWFVLRRHVSWAGWWLLASVVGGVMGGAAGWDVSGNVRGSVFGVSVGMMQWFLLRRHVSRPGWWVLASIVGWYVSWADSASGGLITGITMVWLLRHHVPKAQIPKADARRSSGGK